MRGCSCYKLKNERFQPYAVKVSNSGSYGAADLVLEGAKKIMWLRGVPVSCKERVLALGMMSKPMQS